MILRISGSYDRVFYSHYLIFLDRTVPHISSAVFILSAAYYFVFCGKYGFLGRIFVLMCNSLFEKLITFQNLKRMNLKKYVIAYRRSVGDNLHRFPPQSNF